MGELETSGRVIRKGSSEKVTSEQSGREYVCCVKESISVPGRIPTACVEAIQLGEKIHLAGSKQTRGEIGMRR